jgi:DNA polymerase III delta prime subunit
MSFHKNITDKLTCFIEQNKIPHLLFHGPSGSGKRTLVYKFVANIYQNDKQLMKNYTLFADCAHGKGIKFIREELKFFAKTNINSQGTGHFKTIVLTNADKLTTDAQSALRRCIELFSHNTRFFIIVENKYNLLKPILSRLCEIYIDSPQIETYTSFNTYNTLQLMNTTEHDKKRAAVLRTEINKLRANTVNNINIVKLVNKLYEKGYCGLDLMKYVEDMELEDIEPKDIEPKDVEPKDVEPKDVEPKDIEDIEPCKTDALLTKYKLLMLFHKVKTEFRNENMFMTYILSFLLVRSNSYLDNISFM